MDNQSVSSSSSSTTPKKTDQKFKSAVVTVEEKETMNNPEQRSPQEVVFENTIPDPELPVFTLEVVRTERDNELKYPPKDKNLDSVLSGGTSLPPFQSFPVPSFGLFGPAYGGSSSTNDINLDLTLGPSSWSNTNPSFYAKLFTAVLPCVPRNNFVAGNPGNSSASTHSKSLFSMGKNQAMVRHFASSYPTTYYCYDLFSLQGNGSGNWPLKSQLKENGSGSSHSKSLFSMEKNKAVEPPVAPPNGTTDLLFPSPENGSGSSHLKSLISKGENKVVVPENDDDDDDYTDTTIGRIRWLNKKKRSRPE
ncbi:unnamed protein product [Arabidopsis thaliana]|uniref:Uncharacterized protein n=1 Tax=Arabidopsis thaliana TaxID=3702 RepID=A0A654GAW6_ARATH|nr:unnamed protein product [Arabidopsis thaliana]